MCGIAGYTGSLVPGKIEWMLGRMVHRGPDDWGEHHDERVHLGMRRLAIVDVDGGKQPMFNTARTVVVIFNGEIYNAPELRAELIAKGYRFETTNSDTEVIAHLYDEHGVGFVRHIDGMFAIALFDSATGELFIIRDRIGKKPIFYELTERGIQFASEFNALPLGERATNVDRTAFPWLFAQRSMPQDRSSDRRVRKLPPGSYLRFDAAGSAEIVRWFEIRCSRATPTPSEDEATDRLDALLQKSVERRMRADVPVGVYLSGGVDSSLVLALAARHSARPLDTFCLVYNEEIYEKSADRRFAQEMAQRVSANHEEVLLTPDLLIAELPAILAHFGQPYSGSVANWFVSKAMAGKVKVALTGDGADELFGSYLLHRVAAAIGKSKAHLPELERDLALRGEHEPFATIINAFSVFTPEEQRKLLRPEVLADGTSDVGIGRRYSELTGEDALSRMLEFECRNTLVDVILSYADTLSMAHSIEVRTPFLDHHLVEFAFSLPPEFKICGASTKRVLKRVAARYLPDELVRRKKEGFVEPAVLWLRGELKGLALETILGGRFDRLGLLDKTYAASLVDRFYDTNEFYLGKKVWLLVMYGLWEQAYS